MFWLCLWLPAAAALRSAPLGAGSLRRRQGTAKTTRMEFHAAGDETGDFKLSGWWELTRRPLDDGFKKRHHVLRRSWSGMPDTCESWSGWGWESPFRFALPEVTKTMVTLKARGVFETLPGSADKMKGVWSCDGSEVTLCRFGRGGQVEEWFTGKLANATNEERQTPCGVVLGQMAYGNHEPEYSGTFELKQVLPELNPLQRRIEETYEKFSVRHFANSSFIIEESTNTVFVVRLNPDLTWESIRGVGDSSRFAGKWNVFDESINLGSGIPGTGRRVYLWLRRFGSAKPDQSVSKGVSLTHDHLYIGTIRGFRESPDAPLVVDLVKGSVAIGWSIEPVFVSQFYMKRYFDPEADDDHSESVIFDDGLTDERNRLDDIFRAS